MQNRILLFLISVVFFLNFLSALIPTWRGSFIFNYFTDIESYFTFSQLALMLANTFLGILILLFKLKLRIDNQLYIILILWLSYMLSLLFTSFQTGLMAIFAIPIIYIVIFQIIAHYGIPDKYLIYATLILSTWCILPILYIPIASIEHKIMLFNGREDSLTLYSFGGFAIHRNYYGFYVGLSIILLTFYDDIKKYRIFLYPLLFIGLILSESRSSIIGTITCVAFFYINKKGLKLSKLFPMAIGLGLIAFLWYYFNQNFASREIASNTDRWELYYGFFNIFLDNFFWGTGGVSLYFSNNYPEGSPAHNFILQTLADYGIFTSLVFFFFIGYNFFYGSIYSKILWSYLLVFGLFQPYFTFGIPISFTLIIYLIVAGLYRKNRSNSYSLESKSII